MNDKTTKDKQIKENIIDKRLGEEKKDNNSQIKNKDYNPLTTDTKERVKTETSDKLKNSGKDNTNENKKVSNQKMPKESNKIQNLIANNIGDDKIKKSIISDTENINKRILMAQEFDKYIIDSGLSTAFQIILSELIIKQIKQENYFTYTAMRLRQIGKELEDLKEAKL